MRIAIHGTGVAGPTLAWWLRRHGHDPVLFEKAPRLRTGGYVIDFWGLGYDVAERMGLVPELHALGYPIEELRIVGGDGAPKARLGIDTFRSLTGGRYLSIARGDLAATIYRACDGIDTRFGTSIVDLDQHDHGVRITLDDGHIEDFDLVVGADGLHSPVREIVFGPEGDFERFLGFHVAAFRTRGYAARDERAYVMYGEPGRQIARVALSDDETAFLFIWRSGEIEGEPVPPRSDEEKRRALRAVFGDVGWEAAAILDRMGEAEGLYFDRVSQIRMHRWTWDRVALVGDAAACVSLLAGEGTGLAMVEAYVLAGELARAKGDHVAAFQSYEALLQPFLAEKQRAAMRFAGFFAPTSRLSLWLRDVGVRLSSIPWLAERLVGSSLRDDIVLPDYPLPEPPLSEQPPAGCETWG